MRLDEEGFAEMTRRVVDLAEATAQGRIVLVLEGGYDPPRWRARGADDGVLDGAV